MGYALQLKIGKSLNMTPQLRQSIHLLQLSSMELQVEIQKSLESNMMLETEENGFAENIGGKKQENDDQNATQEDNIYESSAYPSSAYEGSQFDFENQAAHEETLKEHLLWQLDLTPIGDTDRAVAAFIIDALDDDGYLYFDLTDLHSSLNKESFVRDMQSEASEISLDEIEVVLRMIQAMEPAGVAARDLQECLLLQLRQCDKNTPMLKPALVLVKQHFNLLANKDFNRLTNRLKLRPSELQDVIALIRSMDPRPGRKIHATRTAYITPDIYVRKIARRWRVDLNTEIIPHLRVNARYAGMIRRADNSADNVSLKSHLQEARWLIKSLQSRSETLLRVATCIVERQRAFLEYGEEAMQPMVLCDVAEALNMHESTISRVTTGKYIHTPRGLLELKYFFSSHLRTNHGGNVSSTAIRALIKKLIATETPPKPLSDSKIAALLSKQGVNVARRTVAKYREAMTIPPSNERKHPV